MGELSVSLLRLGYLLVLWLFVLAALATLRRDIYGTTIRRRDSQPRERSRSKRRARVGVPVEMAALAGAVATGPAGAPLGAGPLGSPLAGPQAVPPARQSAIGANATALASANAPTRLTVKSGPLRGTTLPLTRSPVVIGRSSTANLVLDDEFASGRHAQLVPRQGGWVLEDLGSTNGTFMGRERITGPVQLVAGQSIRIGNTTLEVLK
ncbi:MAG: FHA domain-containing protein [Bifidobacteriaceae bacterium]|jgi:predicted component of type VI protein secretion system|nr:FHA domain-containing protein [Bifidobacteriaceae bacterium]